MKLKDKVKAVREAVEEKTPVVLKVGGKDYDVHSSVAPLLVGEGVRYLDGEETAGKGGGKVYVTYVRTLKKDDADFEEKFKSIYDTIAGEMLLRDGIDVEGVNPSLKQP